MSNATRECIYFIEHGASCRETDVVEYVKRKINNPLDVRYYVSCKKHAQILKEQNEIGGFLVKVCEKEDQVKQCELIENYRETVKEIVLPVLPQEKGEN